MTSVKKTKDVHTSTFDNLLKKLSDGILTLQKLTNIWVFHATEDFGQEDLASVLPSDEPALKVSVRKASVLEGKLWWLCTILFVTAMCIYLLFFV